MQIQTFRRDKKTGRYLFDNLVFSVKPYYLVPDNANLNASNPEQVQMTASSASAQLPIQSVEEGGIEIMSLSCERTAACLVEIADEVRKHKITGRPVHVDTVFGDGMEPFILPESIFTGRREPLLFRATDLSGSTNAIRPVFHGQRIITERARDPKVDAYLLERQVRSRYALPYLCPLDENPELTADQQSEFTFTQDARGHFEVRKLTYKSTGDFKFKITDETGQSLSNNWVHASAGLGTAHEPFILAGPWVIKAGGNVKVEIKDLSGSANTIYLTLSGRMLFLARR